MSRISFVSSEGNICLINPDGSQRRQLTDSGGPGHLEVASLDTVYAWPAWSPDGTRLAVSRVSVGNSRPELAVMTLDLATGRARPAFVNDPAMFNFVADTMPHYLYWAPDSRHLAFIAATPSGLTLLVHDTESDALPVVAETGGPLYFSWASDSRALLAHRGAQVSFLEAPFGGLARGLLVDSRGYRVPACAPQGRRFAYALAGRAGGSLYVADSLDVGAAPAVLDVGPISAFLWSPDGEELAVADDRDANSPIFRRLRVVAADGSASRLITEEPLVAFYWSPTGEMLAWVGLEPEKQTFVWKVAPRSGESARELFRFQPSAETFAMFQFFDQFAYSHSPWSPDGKQITVAGNITTPFPRRNGHTATGDHIYLVDATGAEPPRELAGGSLSFWGWK